MSDSVRLSKRLAELLPCSRREAELYIEGGWVSVDGAVVEDPHFRVLDQSIVLHPDAVLAPVEPVTLLLHLPPERPADIAEVQTLLNPQTHWVDDPVGIRVLQNHFHRLVHAAPLQFQASGLIVFSQDWRVLRKLQEDAHKNEQEYIVEVGGDIAPDGLARMNKGMRIGNVTLPPTKVSWQNETRLRFAVKNPPLEHIAFMCGSVGLTVRNAKRIRIGGVSMGKLPVGQWRYLAPQEKF